MISPWSTHSPLESQLKPAAASITHSAPRSSAMSTLSSVLLLLPICVLAGSVNRSVDNTLLYSDPSFSTRPTSTVDFNSAVTGRVASVPAGLYAAGNQAVAPPLPRRSMRRSRRHHTDDVLSPSVDIDMDAVPGNGSDDASSAMPPTSTSCMFNDTMPSTSMLPSDEAVRLPVVDNFADTTLVDVSADSISTMQSTPAMPSDDDNTFPSTDTYMGTPKVDISIATMKSASAMTIDATVSDGWAITATRVKADSSTVLSNNSCIELVESGHSSTVSLPHTAKPIAIIDEQNQPSTRSLSSIIKSVATGNAIGDQPVQSEGQSEHEAADADESMWGAHSQVDLTARRWPRANYTASNWYQHGADANATTNVTGTGHEAKQVVGAHGTAINMRGAGHPPKLVIGSRPSSSHDPVSPSLLCAGAVFALLVV